VRIILPGQFFRAAAGWSLKKRDWKLSAGCNLCFEFLDKGVSSLAAISISTPEVRTIVLFFFPLAEAILHDDRLHG
jgi:hypothetical protein